MTKLNATFFALERRDHAVLLPAMLCYVLLAAVLAAIVIVPLFAALGIDFQTLRTGAWTEAPTPPDPMKVLWILPVGFLALFVFYVLSASYEAACLRWMIRGERPGLFGLTLDDDTWRVYGVYWVWLLCGVVAWIGFAILSALLGRLFPENQIVLWVGLGVYVALMGIGAVSLAPAAAVTIAERRFAFFDAFHATEDRFPPLLGSYALLFGGQWLLSYALSAGWVVWALGGRALDRFADVSDGQSFALAYNATIAAAMATPGSSIVYWATSAVSFIVSGLIVVLIYGVNARVARLALEEGKIQQTAPAA